MDAAGRRIACVVLPELAPELVRRRQSVRGPLAVLLALDHEGAASFEQPSGAARIAAVDPLARRSGVRPGQKVSEATALVSGLAVARVTLADVRAALAGVADVALALAPTVAIALESRLPARLSFGARGGELRDMNALAAQDAEAARDPAHALAQLDAVWLDVTGAAHLVGGEDALAAELAERVSALGHAARVAVADGPRLAHAVARWAPTPVTVVPEGGGAAALAPLPVHALPLDPDVASFFVRAGVFSAGDLARLPRSAAAARLGARAAEILDLVAGRDSVPLAPWSPPRVLSESASFEEPVVSVEALLFVARGMTSRLATRLEARGEAASRIEVSIPLDRSIARLRGTEDRLAFDVELPAPLTQSGDLLRPIRARLERLELRAPAVGFSVALGGIVPARRVQLDLSRDRTASPDALPALLAELSAEIGPDRVGVLAVADAHRPEARSVLVPAQAPALGARIRPSLGRPFDHEPTRLLPSPVAVGELVPGAVIAVERRLWTVDSLRFVLRLDGVEWWTSSPSSRDYARAWLVSGDLAGEAWAFVDRDRGEGFVQGWRE